MNRGNIFRVMDAFDELFNTSMFPFKSWNAEAVDGYSCPAIPPVNISFVDTKTKDLKFEFAMAGVNPERVKISFSGDFLELKIDGKEQEDSETRKFLIVSIKDYSGIQNRYFVPSDKYKVDESKAEFKHGLLTVIIPAKEKYQPKLLEIKVKD